ncbi:MAG: VOC family protein [Rubrivivax sp.]|jgi:predicted enzyme related to lactoylglutathione lyase
MKVAAVRLFFDDLAAAVPFYARTLGLPLKFGAAEDGFAVFDGGGVDLVLEFVPDNAPEDERVLVSRFTGISLKVDDVQAEYRRLLDAGTRFDGVPEEQAWGGWLATLVDPGGNQLQLVQYPTPNLG